VSAPGQCDQGSYLVKELEADYATRGASAESLAKVYAGLGKNDQAFAWLEKHLDSGGDLPYLTTTYIYDGLRTDPRYAALVRRIGLRP
jgi:hypothetical protein